MSFGPEDLLTDVEYTIEYNWYDREGAGKNGHNCVLMTEFNFHIIIISNYNIGTIYFLIQLWNYIMSILNHECKSCQSNTYFDWHDLS